MSDSLFNRPRHESRITALARIRSEQPPMWSTTTTPPDPARLIAAAKAVELWIAPPSPEQWEAIAEWFYRDTGILRPGKDQSAAGNIVTDAERELAWDVWCGQTKVRIWNELRAAIAEWEGTAEGAAQTP